MMDVLNAAFMAKAQYREHLYKLLGLRAHTADDIAHYLRGIVSEEDWYGDGRRSLMDALDFGWDYFILGHYPVEPDGGRYWKHAWYLVFWDANDKPYHYYLRLDYRWMQIALRHCRSKGGRMLTDADPRAFLELD